MDEDEEFEDEFEDGTEDEDDGEEEDEDSDDKVVEEAPEFRGGRARTTKVVTKRVTVSAKTGKSKK